MPRKHTQLMSTSDDFDRSKQCKVKWLHFACMRYQGSAFRTTFTTNSLILISQSKELREKRVVMSGNLWLVVTVCTSFQLAFTTSADWDTYHSTSQYPGTAVSTDKRHMELHLAVKVIWKSHKPYHNHFFLCPPPDHRHTQTSLMS